MAENRFEFRYRASDVASAQRMRFMRSNQIKLLLVVWLFSALFVVAPLIFPQYFPGSPFSSWPVVLEIVIIYAVSMAAIVVAMPYLGFMFNRFWRLPLLFQYNEKQLRLSVSGGKSPGLRLNWSEIQRIEENQRVFVMYYGTGNKFLILPKSIFSETAMERFGALLSRRVTNAKKAVPEVESSAEEEL